MKVLCVQCMKLNDLPETGASPEGKIKFPCPHCGFVTVVTRKAARKPVAAAPPPDDEAPTGTLPREAPSSRPSSKPRGTAEAPTRPLPKAAPRERSLEEELFDGSEKQVGDWMVRRLDGTEAGPLTFEALKDMIREGDIGKIDEVRRLEERYVPAAFHELTAELFNELDMAGVSPRK